MKQTSESPRALDLVPGGPSFRLMLRVGLANPEAPRLLRTAGVLVLATWVPLAILTLASGTALLGRIELPFFRDFAVHARLLFAVPLFLLSEVIVGPRLRAVAATFVRSGLVRESQAGAYDDAVRSALRLRDSDRAEFVIAALALAGVVAVGIARLLHPGETWSVGAGDGIGRVTLAGWWYALVGLPVFQFLLIRSIWRGYIWTRFLGDMSKLDLALVATHPDQAGGLGFVGVGQSSWAALVLAVSIVLAGSFADAVLYGGKHVTDFQMPIGAFAAVVAVGLLTPLLRFRGPLARTRFRALLEYGALVQNHHAAFDRKWIQRGGDGDETLLGNADASSLADASTGYQLVRDMKTIPLSTRDIPPLVIPVLLPMLALATLEVPLVDILKKLVAIVA